MKSVSGKQALASISVNSFYVHRRLVTRQGRGKSARRGGLVSHEALGRIFWVPPPCSAVLRFPETARTAADEESSGRQWHLFVSVRVVFLPL